MQSKAIGPILSGRDILVRAKTGTGKTAAFAIPALQNLDLDLYQPQVLVLTPGRELCKQIRTEFLKLGSHMDGLRQLKLLEEVSCLLWKSSLQGAQIICATPGRLMDVKERSFKSKSHKNVSNR